MTKVCLYPFYVIYRASGLNENRKARVKEWLDTLGKWLEQQKIVVDREEYVLSELPPLTDGRNSCQSKDRHRHIWIIPTRTKQKIGRYIYPLVINMNIKSNY